MDGALGFHADQAAEVLPLAPFGEPAHLGSRPDPTLLDPPMAAVGRRGRMVGDAATVVPQALIEQQNRFVMKSALVALQLQDIIAAVIDDLPSVFLLATRRVDGHDSPVKVQKFK